MKYTLVRNNRLPREDSSRGGAPKILAVSPRNFVRMRVFSLIHGRRSEEEEGMRASELGPPEHQATVYFFRPNTAICDLVPRGLLIAPDHYRFASVAHSTVRRTTTKQNKQTKTTARSLSQTKTINWLVYIWYRRSSRKRTPSGRRNSVRNWSWSLTRMSKYKVYVGAR